MTGAVLGAISLSSDSSRSQACGLGRRSASTSRIFVLSKLRTVQAIVTHLQTFPQSRARAACRRALHYRNFTYAGIKDILRRGIDLVPLPGGGNKLEGHWSHKPRFSRVPEKQS